jgi:hypothetical protein
MNTSSARSMAAWNSVALVAACLVAGCAQLTDAECRSADWYQLGYRDADIYGLRPQIDQYAYQCREHGVQPAEPTYMAGWVDGYREWNKRVSGSECCAP